jgi:DNA-binding IclR family transcriptional regulator
MVKSANIAKNVRLSSRSPKSVRRNKKNGGKSTPVKSISRAAGILRCLSHNINSIKDIAEHCDLSMATVHRILQTLEESGLAFQDPADLKYYLGPLFTQLLLDQVNDHKFLTAQSVGELNRISELFGEFTVLDVEVGMQIITLIQIQSRFNYSIIRPEKQMFYSSVSRALLVQHSDDEIALMLSNTNLKPPTEHFTADKKKLKEQYKEERRQGYSICRGLNEGVVGISVPVRDYTCLVALTVVGPEVRLDSVIADVIREMMISAGRISDSLSRSR